MAASATPADGDEPVSGVTPTFAQVYDEYFEYVWRTARRLGVSSAAVDDVVQDAFLVVHRRLAEPRSGSLRAWLYGITVHTVRNHRRTLRRKSPHERGGAVDPDTLVTSAHDPERAAQKAEAAQALHAILDTMDDAVREVFVLVELEQLAAPEVASIVDAKLNTVYSRLRLARAAFEAAVKSRLAREHDQEKGAAPVTRHGGGTS